MYISLESIFKTFVHNRGSTDVSTIRHGWGCTPDPTQAVKYLSAAASNAASIEDLALQAGMKKGGSAKGELVLAIFELANCFRHGWGVAVDKVAAKQVCYPGATKRIGARKSLNTKANSLRQYYETAANLGDTGTRLSDFRLTVIKTTNQRLADAMNEVGWCYIEGFGCKKDKVR